MSSKKSICRLGDPGDGGKQVDTGGPRRFGPSFGPEASSSLPTRIIFTHWCLSGLGANPCCVTLDKLLHVSEPQFAEAQNGDNKSTCLRVLLQGMNNFLTSSKDSIQISHYQCLCVSCTDMSTDR